ncbi:PIN domain-containing protein [Actinoplanes sp. NPDC000266]
MKAPTYLVDTSAFFRLLRNPELSAIWYTEMRHGLFGVCEITELEILHGAHSRAHRDRLEEVLKKSYQWIVMPDRVWPRAKVVQRLLTHGGSHKSAGPVDLLAAAAAEEHVTRLPQSPAKTCSGSRSAARSTDGRCRRQRWAAASASRMVVALAGVPIGFS